MRVSKHFRLGRNQGALDFVDVDTRRDTRLYLSPSALAQLSTPWGDECVYLVQDFFQRVLNLIKNGRNEAAEALLRYLREPNETRLGMSKHKADGRALGESSAHDVWRALSRSEAVQSGLLADLEDTVLFVRNVGIDKISDITTVLIRRPLVEYTQEQCHYFGIPLRNGVAFGPIWRPEENRWVQTFVDLPVVSGLPLLLVPKGIVRKSLDYDADDYYTNFILEHLKGVELEANSQLVELLKNGRRRVTKKSLREKYGIGKEAIIRTTLQHPDMLARYKEAVGARSQPSLSHEALSEETGGSLPDWDRLLQAVLVLPVGRDTAGAYENAIEALLSALFYPLLQFGRLQTVLHGGLKRIDIQYVNSAQSGFFGWLSRNYSASHIQVECKNFGNEVANTELDQLSGRFSPSRGQVGFMVVRQFKDKRRFMERCARTASDGRGYILALDDNDLRRLVAHRIDDPLFARWEPIQELFRALVNG